MIPSSSSDFKHRKSLAWIVFNKLKKIWQGTNIPIKLKINIFNVSVVSIFLYGCETWTINEPMIAQINSLATACYRVMLNIKWHDHVSNKDIYNMTKQRPLIETVWQRQLSWVGHTLRRDDQELAKIFALYEPTESLSRNRKRGAKPLNYKKYIASLITINPEDYTARKIVEIANDRKEWRKLVTGCVYPIE